MMVEFIDKELKNYSVEEWIGLIFSSALFVIFGGLGFLVNYLSGVESSIVILIGITWTQTLKNHYRINHLKKK